MHGYVITGVGSIHALDPATGQHRWVYTTGGWSFGGAVMGNVAPHDAGGLDREGVPEGGGERLLFATSYDWTVHALREGDGSPVWKWSATAPIRGAVLFIQATVP